MRGIIKMTIKDIIKQPFYYIGLILCCFYVYVNLCQYLDVKYFEISFIVSSGFTSPVTTVTIFAG